MKSFNVSETSGKSTFQQCELTIKNNLFQSEFFKLNSSFSLKSIFKTPNLKSHSLLKEDFYAALSTEDMLTDENKYVLLINNALIDETKTFGEFKSTIDKQESSSSNKLKNEYDGTLMENLVNLKINFLKLQNPNILFVLISQPLKKPQLIQKMLRLMIWIQFMNWLVCAI